MYIELKTNRLILRPLSIDDLDTVHAYASDINNTKYMINLPNATKNETLNFLQRVTQEWQKDEPSFYEFAITLDAKQIGAVSVSLNEQRIEGELGWIVNKDFWGKGYATEAAKAVKEFALNELKVSIFVAHCDYRNTASCRIMEKIGLSLVSDDGMRQYSRIEETAKELMYSLNLSEIANNDNII